MTKLIKSLHIFIVNVPVPRPTYELLMILSMRDFPTKMTVLAQYESLVAPSASHHITDSHHILRVGTGSTEAMSDDPCIHVGHPADQTIGVISGRTGYY